MTAAHPEQSLAASSTWFEGLLHWTGWLREATFPDLLASKTQEKKQASLQSDKARRRVLTRGHLEMIRTIHSHKMLGLLLVLGIVGHSPAPALAVAMTTAT